MSFKMSSAIPIPSRPLTIYAEDSKRNRVQLAPTSTRYKIVEAFVQLALSLLETDEAKTSLAEVATAIIQTREKTPGSSRHRPSHIYRDSLQNMPYWIRRFLQIIRNNFFPICISPLVGGEAEAAKSDWGTDMDQYDAGPAAGMLYVSEAIISNMTYVRQNLAIAGNSYDVFKFQMVISVAHEIVHFLTGFITGTSEPNTPQDINVPRYDVGGEWGEAGRYWENLFLGGLVECWSVVGHPLGDRQAGVLHLFDPRKRETATGQEVSMAYVRELLDGQFTFPIRVSAQSPVVTRRMLERQKRKETTKLRNSPEFKRAGRTDSPPPGQPSTAPGLRFRSTIPGPAPGYSAGLPSRPADYTPRRVDEYAGMEDPRRRYYYR